MTYNQLWQNQSISSTVVSTHDGILHDGHGNSLDNLVLTASLLNTEAKNNFASSSIFDLALSRSLHL